MSYITLKRSFPLLSRPVNPTPESEANGNLNNKASRSATADDDTLKSTTLTSEPVPYPR